MDDHNGNSIAANSDATLHELQNLVIGNSSKPADSLNPDTTLDTLPQELLVEISSHLLLSADLEPSVLVLDDYDYPREYSMNYKRADLLNMALTGRKFNSLATTALYRHFFCCACPYFDNEDSMKERYRVLSFLKTIIACPDLACKVKVISVGPAMAERLDAPLRHLDVLVRDQLMEAAQPYLHLDTPDRTWERAIKAGGHAGLIAMVLCLCHSVSDVRYGLDYQQSSVSQNLDILRHIANRVAYSTSSRLSKGFSSLTRVSLSSAYVGTRVNEQGNLDSLVPYFSLPTLREITLGGHFPGRSRSGVGLPPCNVTTMTISNGLIGEKRFPQLIKACPALKSLKIKCGTHAHTGGIRPEYGLLIKLLIENAPGLEELEISLHCGEHILEEHSCPHSAIYAGFTKLQELRIPSAILLRPDLPQIVVNILPSLLRRLVLYNIDLDHVSIMINEYEGLIKMCPLLKELELDLPISYQDEDCMFALQLLLSTNQVSLTLTGEEEVSHVYNYDEPYEASVRSWWPEVGTPSPYVSWSNASGVVSYSHLSCQPLALNCRLAPSLQTAGSLIQEPIPPAIDRACIHYSLCDDLRLS
ncbi:hypothetical protein EJ08DRAFT_456009 [Tothia fuscella]|uniref:F-box domain-containing protein n=1 Tax=Tothia fuscella TaxID=1048955 RepID=A0A9P4NJ33_9PEZI|nr:hypothetical protein EJ08DRAFT_456009 [Tothia fuscella]